MSEEAIKMYIERGGNSCFKCSSDNIEGGSFTTDSGKAMQSVWCTECGHQWEDTYTLTGIVK